MIQFYFPIELTSLSVILQNYWNNLSFIFKPFNVQMNFPIFLQADNRTHLFQSLRKASMIYERFPYLQAFDESSDISIIISTQAFLIAQLFRSFALPMQNPENLLEKNYFETSLDIMGRCFMAYFLTLTLESSPRESISNPINRSQSYLPKQSLMLLKSCMATIRLSQLESLCAISSTSLRTQSPRSLSLSLCVIRASSCPAISLIYLKFRVYV